MTIQEAIGTAIDGGWESTFALFPNDKKLHQVLYGVEYPVYQALLDPHFWKSLGKVRKWENRVVTSDDEALRHMHEFIDWLWQGGTIEDYFDENTEL